MNAGLKKQLESAKKASYQLSSSSTEQRNAALQALIKHLQKGKLAILKANRKDVAKKNKDDALVDRLLLTEKRIDAICADIKAIIGLPDPLNISFDKADRPSGLRLKKVTVPLGTIAIVYESRPNVTVDISSLCIKSGNTVILRGGSDAYATNQVLAKLIQAALKEASLDPHGVQLMNPDRKLVKELLTANEYIDLVIPRGGKNLIEMVRKESTVPTIETGASVVHTYVDEHVDLNKAAEVIFNEKIRRVSVCNALDTLLVNKNIAQKFLHLLAEKLKNHSPVVELRADQVSVKFLKSHYPANKLKAVREKDYATEFLDYVMNIKVVKNIDEAIAHIRKYSLKHSEAILTDNKRHAEKFQREVDAACVYVNTSTCFSDGAEFGLGAEVGISTQKMHARGPMGLRELTSYKWLIDSNYQIRL